MDKLEHYLDQVCRGIGGPRSLRQHIRQELREHLRDAMAQHKAAGMTEEAALDRALEDFGGPEEVRSELEATHGHRVMTVVIDKAMQWKEKTMKAKWLWTTWVHLVLAGVISVELLFITFATIFITPRIKMMIREGWIGVDRSEPALAWVPGFFGFQDWLANNTTWLLLGTVVLWGLFEWRVRGENKTLMRLGAFGTVGFALSVVVILTGASLVLPVAATLPALVGLAPEPIVVKQTAAIDKSIRDLQEAIAEKDWDAAQNSVTAASEAARVLDQMGSAGPTLASLKDKQDVEDLRDNLKAGRKWLVEAQRAVLDKDPGQLEEAMSKFQIAYGPVRAAAKKAQ